MTTLKFFSEEEHKLIAKRIDDLEVMIQQHMEPVCIAIGQRIGTRNPIVKRLRYFSLLYKTMWHPEWSLTNKMRLLLYKLYHKERNIDFEVMQIPTPYDKLKEAYKDDDHFHFALRHRLRIDGFKRPRTRPKKSKNVARRRR